MIDTKTCFACGATGDPAGYRPNTDRSLWCCPECSPRWLLQLDRSGQEAA